MPDKWIHKITTSLPGGPNTNERVAQAKEFFDLGLEVRQLEQQLLFPENKQISPNVAESTLTTKINHIKDIRQSLQPNVEDTIETEITRVLKQENLSSPFGVFPPVDAVFTSSPHVLILSPRDRIFRQQDILLNPGLNATEKELIEAKIFEKEDLSVYIENTGGVAVYPSVVSDEFGLQNATNITVHEWLHHWLLFRPMGRNFWNSAEMTSLNETVAELAGNELGNKVFTSLTGEVIEPAKPSSTTSPDPAAFDFRAEMQKTRIQAEKFLAAGEIDKAEAYMEDRRQIFLDNGYLIRKINQAYFAFHGTYAASAASISPIGNQVQELRDQSDSLEHFLNTVSTFSTYQKFLDHLENLR